MAQYPNPFAKSGHACRGSGLLLNCKNDVVYPSVRMCAQLITSCCLFSYGFVGQQLLMWVGETGSVIR